MDILDNYLLVIFAVLVIFVLFYVFCYYLDGRDLEMKIKKYFNEGKKQELLDYVSKYKHRKIPVPISLLIANSYSSLGKLAEALSVYENLMKTVDYLNPFYAEILLEMGNIHFQKIDYKRAEVFYREGVKLFSNHIELRYKLALLFYQTDRLEEAAHTLQKVFYLLDLSVDDKDHKMRSLYAEILAAQGKYAKAYPYYAGAEKIGKIFASKKYADTLAHTGHYEKALAAYHKLIYIEQNADQRDSFILICAQLYKNANIRQEGLIFLEKYIKQTQGNTQWKLRYIEAQFLEGQGDIYRALASFSSIHNENPLFEDVADIVAAWGNILKYPVLKNYFVSSFITFERFVQPLLSSSVVITKRTPLYFIVTQGLRAFIFYRHYKPVPANFFDEIDNIYPTACFRASIIEIWSFFGVEKDAVLDRKQYTVVSVHGASFIKKLQGPQEEGRKTTNQRMMV